MDGPSGAVHFLLSRGLRTLIVLARDDPGRNDPERRRSARKPQATSGVLVSAIAGRHDGRASATFGSGRWSCVGVGGLWVAGTPAARGAAEPSNGVP